MQKKVTEFSTDTQNEFLDNFYMMTEFYKEFRWNNKSDYYKRTILSLHMTLQSLFVLFLDRISSKIIWVRKNFISEQNTPKANISLARKYPWFTNEDLELKRSELINDLQILKWELEEIQKKAIRESIYNNEVYHYINDRDDLANFNNLRDRVKKSTDEKYWFNINITEEKVEERDKTIKRINVIRNDFIHFKPKNQFMFLDHDFNLGKWCLDIIEHIICNCKQNDEFIQINMSAFFIYGTDAKKSTEIKQEIIDSLIYLKSL